MTEPDVIAALSALAQETRLRVLRYLVTKGPDGAAAGEVAGAVNASPSRASFHLSTLADAGLITAKRDARSIIYRVDFDRMGALMGYLVHDCCANNAKVRSCC